MQDASENIRPASFAPKYLELPDAPLLARLEHAGTDPRRLFQGNESREGVELQDPHLSGKWFVGHRKH